MLPDIVVNNVKTENTLMSSSESSIKLTRTVQKKQESQRFVRQPLSTSESKVKELPKLNEKTKFISKVASERLFRNYLNQQNEKHKIS